MKQHIVGKKAQAAMEFMMTYGWAIMALAISIAALSYFNAFSFSPQESRCLLSPGLNCDDIIIGNNGIAIELSNGLGDSLNNVIVSVRNLPSGITCSDSSSQTLNEGERKTFTVACSSMDPGKKINAEIYVTYTPSGNILSKTSTGTVNGVSTNVLISLASAPSISNVQSSSITSTSATISWTTNSGSATNLVKYGTSSGSYTFSQSASAGISPSAGLTSLSSSTTYYYVVNSTNVNGSSQSSESSFSTSGASDSQAPTFSSPSKLPSTVYQNNVTRFNMTIMDNVQLAGYRLSVNQGAGYVNQTYVPTSGTSIVASQTATITANPGTTVYWMYIADDSSGNIASSAVQSFVIDSLPVSKRFLVDSSFYFTLLGIYCDAINTGTFTVKNLDSVARTASPTINVMGYDFEYNFLTSGAGAGSVSISPSSRSINPGETYTFTINLNSLNYFDNNYFKLNLTLSNSTSVQSNQESTVSYFFSCQPI